MTLRTDAQDDVVTAVAPPLDAEVIGYIFFVGLFHSRSQPGFIPAHPVPFRCSVFVETALLRSMLDRLNAGNVLLGDSYFCSYFMIALPQERGVDMVFRLGPRSS